MDTFLIIFETIAGGIATNNELKPTGKLKAKVHWRNFQGIASETD